MEASASLPDAAPSSLCITQLQTWTCAIHGKSFIWEPAHVWRLHAARFCFCDATGFLSSQNGALCVFFPLATHHVEVVQAECGPPIAPMVGGGLFTTPPLKTPQCLRQMTSSHAFHCLFLTHNWSWVVLVGRPAAAGDVVFVVAWGLSWIWVTDPGAILTGWEDSSSKHLKHDSPQVQGPKWRCWSTSLQRSMDQWGMSRDWGGGGGQHIWHTGGGHRKVVKLWLYNWGKTWKISLTSQKGLSHATSTWSCFPCNFDRQFIRKHCCLLELWDWSCDRLLKATSTHPDLTFGWSYRHSARRWDSFYANNQSGVTRTPR